MLVTTIATSIEINVPVQTAYNQWTQFEEFPKFMEGIIEVQQLNDRRLHWKAVIGGLEKEWDAEITEQIPDRCIAWKNVGGAHKEGIVTFEPLSDGKSTIRLHIDYDTEGIVETIGDEMGTVSTRVTEDLKRFKSFIEAQGKETGAWRGKI
jgi:uncharacterized membrane protein